MSNEQAMQGSSILDTALELSQKPNSIFRRALLGGYRVQDVDHYVERAADVLEQLIAENRELRVEIDRLREIETTFRTALGSAQKFADNMVSAAKRETAALLAHARAAQEELDDAEALSANGSLSNNIKALRTHRDRLSAELSTALESHIRLLDTVETNTPSEDAQRKIKEILEENR